MHFNIINSQGADLDAMLQEMEDRVDHNQFYQFQNSLTQEEIDRIIYVNIFVLFVKVNPLLSLIIMQLR